MILSILTSINLLAILVASLIFFFLGSLWFSALFGQIWSQELKQHNVIIKEPTKNTLFIKMLLTFASNIVASVAMAYLIKLTGNNTIFSALCLGIIVTLGFAATTLATVFVWESRSLKLFLIDIGYPALGIISSAIILSLWQ